MYIPVHTCTLLLLAYRFPSREFVNLLISFSNPPPRSLLPHLSAPSGGPCKISSCALKVPPKSLRRFDWEWCFSSSSIFDVLNPTNNTHSLPPPLPSPLPPPPTLPSPNPKPTQTAPLPCLPSPNSLPLRAPSALRISPSPPPPTLPLSFPSSPPFSPDYPLSVTSCSSRPRISYVFGVLSPFLRILPRTLLARLLIIVAVAQCRNPGVDPTSVKSRLALAGEQHPGYSSEQAAAINLNGRHGHEWVR